jgi:hypothetical protein
MATVIYCDDFSEQLAKGVHNFDGTTHTFKLALTNTAIATSVTNKAGITSEIAYTNISGGVNPTVSIGSSETTGTMTIHGDEVVITATGVVPDFRYYALYNDSATSPTDALVISWDHGSTVSLTSGETFTIKFNNTSVNGTIMTVAHP